LAAVCFVAVVALRIAVQDPSEPVALLFVIPIAVMAVEFGRMGGLVTAGLASLVFVLWAILSSADVSAIGYGTRLLAFLVLGGLVGHLTDQRARATAQSERWFEMSNDMLATASLDGYFTRLNPAWERGLGHGAQELMSRPYVELVHPEDLQTTLEAAGSLAEGPSEIVGFENRYQTRDGQWRWLLWSARSDGKRVYAVAKDINERKQAELALRTSERRLRSILDHTPAAVSVRGRDHRYQLVNRGFEEQVGLGRDRIIGRLDEEVLPPAVVALERQSHDLVLATGESVETEEVVARDGEDHVYLMIKFPLRDEAGTIHAVCGVFTDITDLKRREEDLRDRLEWTDRITNVVASGQMLLYGQPIVEIGSGKVEQAELLVRMPARPGSSVVTPPSEFLPAAERFDLVGIIDLWVVARAVEFAKHGRRVEVNLSGKTISDPGHVAEIERLVLDSGAPPENIVFEITETAVVGDLASARHFAQRLRELGCLFALDDFGVGYGTFTYLKRLPVDFLKIDIEFVHDLVRDESDRQVVHAIVGVARDFGMKTIAEGVEDQATAELLGVLGVDYAQGYWYGHPEPIDELWPTITDSARTA